MTTAVLSDLLLGTTKGPPESPLQAAFPSSPAQRYILVFLKHLEGGSIGNPTYRNFSGYGPLPTMICTVKYGILLPKLF